MNPDYQNNVINDIADTVKQYNEEIEFNNLTNVGQKKIIDIANKVIDDKTILGYKYEGSEYVENDDEKDCTYVSATLNFMLSILSNNVSVLSDTEEFIKSLFSSSRHYCVEMDRKIDFDVKIDINRDISRKSKMYNGEKIYETDIFLLSSKCPIFYEEIPDAIIQLDENINVDIVKRLVSVEKMLSQSNNKNETQQNELNKLWDKYDELLLKIGNRELFNYTDIFDLMKKNECNVFEAKKIVIDKLTKEKENVAKREKAIEKRKQESKEYRIKLLKNAIDLCLDEPEIQRYTLAVISDIRSRLSIELNVPIIGIDNYNEWIDKIEDENFNLPCVFISANIHYGFGLQRMYSNIDSNNVIVKHEYNQNAFLLYYGIMVNVLYHKSDNIDYIIDKFMKIYGENPVTVQCSDIKYPKETIQLYIHFNNKSPIYEDKSDSDFDIFSKRIESVQYNTVHYFSMAYGTKGTCKHNEFLRMLQLADINNLHRCNIINQQKNELVLFERLFQNSGFLNNLFGPIQNKEYKTLKLYFQQRKPVSKELFDSALPNLTLDYPELFFDMVNGYSVETIKKKLEEILNLYTMRWENMCERLDIPSNINVKYFGYTKHDINMRGREGLSYCIGKISANPLSKIYPSIIFDEYKYMVMDDIQKEMQKIEREDEERAQREERKAVETNGGSSGGIIDTALGVALGNKISGNSRKKSEKKDMFGTSVCVRIKKNHLPSCGGCPVQSRCTQQY